MLVGPNGAGKSSLLRAVAGLAPIDAGTIRLDGAVLDDPGAGVFVPPERGPVAMMFQDGLLFRHLDALDNVAFGPRARGMRKARANARARELLARLGLERRGRTPSRTSSRAARRNASRWRARSRSSRARCCSTSRSPRSTRRRASTCGARSASSSRRSTACACS